ncbi:DUF3558 domain-containing protein [Saccharothrix violaceirubra]|nr:DUF3558 domain-containing protein [Saccharothrix violaceirubra]
MPAIAVIAIASVVGLAACANPTTTGSPSAESTRGSVSSGATPTSTGGRPSTGDDLDIAKFADKPCELVTPEQLASLGKLRPAKPESDPFGVKCVWPGNDPRDDTSYIVTLLSKGGTFEVRRDNAKDLPVFAEVTVGGRDAFSYDTTDGKSSCSTGVKVSAEHLIMAQSTLGRQDAANAGKPCQASEKLAAIVVSNLKG